MKDRYSVKKLALLGMMTAMVFASNYLRVTMPIAIGGKTSFTLANIICCLSGTMLGPVGGFASGLGSALYDLTNPLFAAECWITFLTKGAMGLFAGLAVKGAVERDEMSYGKALFSAICGCGAYYILYFLKCFAYDGLLIEGLQVSVALGILPLKVPASIFNAAVAIIASPPLTMAIRTALKRAGLGRLTRA